MIRCPKCDSEKTVKYGKSRSGKQQHRCNNCRYQFSSVLEENPTERVKISNIKCPDCGSINTRSHEKFSHKTAYKCKDCGKHFTLYKADEQKESMNENQKPIKIGMSILEFRQRHDVEFIIQSVLKKLEKDIIYEKSDILRMTGLRAGYPGLSQTLDDKKFQEYRGRAGGIIYYSHPDTINRLKEETIMV